MHTGSLAMAKAKFGDFGEKHAGVVCLLIYLAGSAWRMRAFLFEGRFWAEEGQVFFPALHGASLLQALTFLFNGHLELFTNLTVWFATMMPFRYAPLLTTYASLSLQLVTLWLLLTCRRELGLSAVRCMLLVLIAVTLPQGAEVWANAINLHFHFALLAGIILVANHGTAKAQFRATGLLLCCGLSGIPANFLTPCFALKALVSRARGDIIHFLTLLATSGLQLFLLSRNPSAVASRVIELDARAGVLAYISQAFLTPALPAEIAQQIAKAFSDQPQGLYSSELRILALVFVVCGLMVVEIVRRGTVTSRKLLLVSLYLAACLVAAALGLKGDRVTFAGRYFYAPVVLFYASVLTLAPKRLVLGWALLAMTLVQAPANGARQFRGPDWSDALAEAQREHLDVVAIWPRRWTVPMPK